jgi:hypothetical protein
MRPTLLAAASALLAALGARAAEPAAPDAKAVEFFEARVRPLFVEKCVRCHGPDKQRGGLRLDSRAALMKGGDDGAVVVPGDAGKSHLIQAVRGEGDVKKMPPAPNDPLPDGDLATLTDWVKMGAPWPDRPGDGAGRPTVAEARQRHWAFRPVKKPGPPAVKDAGWVKTPIDAFILEKLEEKGLHPAKPADRRTLIRRLSFDLLGLPPTPEEVEAFVGDPDPDAYEKLVDRLLASPHYGERWGRYWLDVARYADTKGYVFTEERRFPYSYTYRDYVIRAFNEDLPYDQFILQQLAADKLDLGDGKRPLAALGFLTLGRRFLNNRHDIIDDRIDVTMRGFEGLTVGCARCHDHKFDPIPQKDYYSLYGVFANSEEPKELPAIGPTDQPEAAEAFEAELKKRADAVAAFREEHKAELEARNRKFRDDLRKLENKVAEWQATAPGGPVRAMALEDAAEPHDYPVLLRGNPSNPGPVVPRQFPEVLAGEGRKPFTQGSGRLELARAIADKDNPLTARVLVNRVWMHHFGEGLVRTPSNFGLRGDPPTHPELLDYLAARFVEDGWSVKKLHRLILLSATYRQASDEDDAHRAADPENRLLGHMNRLRLEFEPLRDSLLSVAGRLDDRMGGKGDDLTAGPPFARRRTVYGFIDRQNLPGLFRTFDLASPDATNAQRHMTTTPQQALFLMNAPFVVEQARAFVARPDVVALKTDEERIDRLYRLAYGRPPDPDEVALGLKFLAAAKADGPGKPDSGQLSPWEQYGQALLLSNEFAFGD